VKNELAFDNVNETKNYKKLVRGSLHTFRGLPRNGLAMGIRNVINVDARA